MNSIFLIFLLLFDFGVANAKLIQILHTNDTHSNLAHTPHNENNGGAARLKSLMDYYKDKMSSEGISTLVMDGGDFTEGNIYYMADSARKTFEVHNEMGYDVTTLGNHDYLMGTRELDKLLGEVDLKFALIAANLEINYDYKNLRAKIKPFKEFEIDGIKIGVLGLTTNEIFYKWRFEAGRITNPIKAAKRYEKILKQRKNDFIIALSHLGDTKDVKLAEKTKDIDLIIGGHSHTAMFTPNYVSNKEKRLVPIVQAGSHTEYLGRLVIDCEVNKPLKIVSYELIPVKYEAIDYNVKALVEEADNDLHDSYGKSWLNKKVGFSDLNAGDKDGTRKWAYFITDTIKEKSNADIGIHAPDMNGANYPIGIITRRSLFDSVPRVFELSQKYGWGIYTTRIKGVWLRLTFELITHFGQPITFSGVKMEVKRTKFGLKFNRMIVNGKSINPFKYYTVAFTEGVVRGAKGINPLTLAILRNPKDSNYKIWSSLEEKLSKNLSLDKISEEGHLLVLPDLKDNLDEE